MSEISKSRISRDLHTGRRSTVTNPHGRTRPTMIGCSASVEQPRRTADAAYNCSRTHCLRRARQSTAGISHDARNRHQSNTTATEDTSFAETALTLGGKSADEARRTGAIDTADDQVEALFAPEYQTVNSPAHRAVWDRGVPVELFTSTPPKTPPDVQQVMDDSIAVVAAPQGGRHAAQRRRQDRRARARRSWAAAGYWGLLGRQGIRRLRRAVQLVRAVSHADGARRPDRRRPGLGPRLHRRGRSGPHVRQRRAEAAIPARPGQRLAAQRVRPHRAVRRQRPDGAAHHRPARRRRLRRQRREAVHHQRRARPDDRPGLPDRRQAGRADRRIAARRRTSNFQLRKYGLWALKHTYNRGIIFRDFRVPAENLLTPPRGDGLTIAYHGLNLGRVALCANAAGTMRLMMASMIPWAKFRRTYGAAIATRELVQRRLGELAGLIVACDALVAWCAGLIDHGYRGEMECIVAKIFGSEAQKHAAIEFFMKTHGGRSFLHGHNFGDNIHEYLAPCIYEGEGEMLGMGFFKSLVKHHGKTYFEPIGKALAAAGIRQPNPLNPAHAWALKGVALPYAEMGRPPADCMPLAAAKLPEMPKALREHAEFACERLQRMALEISSTMSRFQLKLADRQCRMAELSQRCQDLITILTTSMYGARQRRSDSSRTPPTSCARTCARNCSAAGRRTITSAA